MRFIKASERLPTKEWKGAIRIDGEKYSGGKFELDTIRVDLWRNPYCDPIDYPRIEWLDEFPEPLPADIVSYINEEAEKYVREFFPTSGNQLDIDTFTAGANLLSQKLKEKDEEIERLKGLIETAFKKGHSVGWVDCEHNTITGHDQFQQFKIENNLS